MEDNKKLMYTPNEHIPIGEPVKLPDGSMAIRYKRKRGKCTVTEVVPWAKQTELLFLELKKQETT